MTEKLQCLEKRWRQEEAAGGRSLEEALAEKGGQDGTVSHRIRERSKNRSCVGFLGEEEDGEGNERGFRRVKM